MLDDGFHHRLAAAVWSSKSPNLGWFSPAPNPNPYPYPNPNPDPNHNQCDWTLGLYSSTIDQVHVHWKNNTDALLSAGCDNLAHNLARNLAKLRMHVRVGSLA
eukprot:scaffold1834_cov61-Phaeocystis_antarctica.AAC.1